MRKNVHSQPSESEITNVSSLRLSELHIYPIKSARGISLSAARVDLRGLEHDRRWMVVDEQGKFLTQRSIPRMALIHVELGLSHLVVKAESMNDLLLPLRPEPATMLRVLVWKDYVNAIDTGEEAAAWFTEMLSRPCRLVYMPDTTERIANPKYAPRKAQVSFVDAFPFMLLSQASLNELNSRLARPVPMNRFRPNLVIEGCRAYEEDLWANLRIGDVGFEVAKPCERCTIPTVDQETGIRVVGANTHSQFLQDR